MALKEKLIDLIEQMDKELILLDKEKDECRKYIGVYDPRSTERYGMVQGESHGILRMQLKLFRILKEEYPDAQIAVYKVKG